MMDEAVAWVFPINKASILNIVVSLQKGAPTKSQNAPPINVKRPRTTLVARRRTNIIGYASDSFPTTQVIAITSFRAMEGLYNVGNTHRCGERLLRNDVSSGEPVDDTG